MWLGMICSSVRSPAGSSCRSGVHPENVCGLEPRQRQDHLLPFHLCHRHQKHPLCLCCCQGHHLTANPQRIQPGVKTAGQGPELSSGPTPSRPEIPPLPLTSRASCPPLGWSWCVFSCLESNTEAPLDVIEALMFTVKLYYSQGFTVLVARSPLKGSSLFFFRMKDIYKLCCRTMNYKLLFFFMSISLNLCLVCSQLKTQ